MWFVPGLRAEPLPMSDRIFGILVGLVALGFMFSATKVQTSFLSDPVGPKLFPIIIAVVALLCAVSIIINPDKDPVWPPLKVFLSLAVCTAVLIGYAYSLKPFGFLFPTAVCTAVLSYQIHPRVTSAILTGIGLSIGLFLLFRYALGLSLFAFPRDFGSF